MFTHFTHHGLVADADMPSDASRRMRARRGSAGRR
jgi:hypothetical protein